MLLKELLSPWMSLSEQTCEVHGLANDSRKVKPGDLFFAYPGVNVDGRLFMHQARTSQAAAILYDTNNAPADLILPQDIICIPISTLENKLAAIANRFYGDPTQELLFTGVTGTNGKTTIAYQLAQAHILLGVATSYIGTIGQGNPLKLEQLVNTTPDALVLQSLFREYQQRNIKQVCMEVSSHALCQQRVANIPFQQAIFTNLTHDHLDYHQTMENYAQAKSSLFATQSLKCAIINFDDQYAKIMQQRLPGTCDLITYGFNNAATVRVLNWDAQAATVKIQSPWDIHEIPLTGIGKFNVYNTLAIFISLKVSGYDVYQIIDIMRQIKPAPGRMELLHSKPSIIVDYAHTPDALENVLVTLNILKKGRLILVFGCGGDRDHRKRPLMGRIAVRYADVIIITNDNPRHEKPEDIMLDIMPDLNADKIIYKILDRAQAIHAAYNLSTAEDIILIAGKGHEMYQQIGDQKLFFSDQKIVQELGMNCIIL